MTSAAVSPVTRWLAAGAICLAAAAWGISFVPGHMAVEHYPVLTFLAARFIFGAAVLLPLAASGSQRRDINAGIREGLVPGLLYGAGYILQMYGFQFTTPAKSGFITAFGVVLVPIITCVLLRTRVSSLGWASVATAFVGLTMISGVDPMDLTSANPGDALTLMCAFVFSGYVVSLGICGKGVGAVPFSAGQLLVAAVPLTLIALAVDGVPQGLDSRFWLLVVAAALLSKVIAVVADVWGQKHTSPVVAGVLLGLEPVFAALASWYVLGETFSLAQLIGMALLLTGAVAIQFSSFSEAQQLEKVA